MAGGKGIRAGRAFVELFADDSALARGLKQAQAKLRAFGQTVKSIGRNLFVLGGAGVAAFIPTIRAASDAQRTLSKFRAVFGDQADAAEAFADTLASTVGRSGLEVKNALATFQAFFVGLGFGSDEALKMSETMERLALDFASFHNLSDQEAMERFISALSGSSEVLDRFGINTKQAALEAELLSQGIDKPWTDVTENEKALARLNVIIGAMGQQGAVGDAVRTQASFANQLKRAGAELTDLKVAIGQALLPALTPLLKVTGMVVGVFGEFVKQNPRLVASVFVVTAGLAVLGTTLLAVAAAATLAGGPLVVLVSMLAGVGLAAAASFGLMADTWNLTIEGMTDMLGSWAKSAIDYFATVAKGFADLFGLFGLLNAGVLKQQIDAMAVGAKAAIGVIGAAAQGAIQDAIKKFDIGGGIAGGIAGRIGVQPLGTFSGDPRQFYAGRPDSILPALGRLTNEVAKIRSDLNRGLALS